MYIIIIIIKQARLDLQWLVLGEKGGQEVKKYNRYHVVITAERFAASAESLHFGVSLFLSRPFYSRPSPFILVQDLLF